MKRIILLFAFLAVVCASLASQSQVPHYVVVTEAESEINELEENNRSMAQRNSELDAESSNLENEIEKSREFIVLADDMADRLSASAGEIYTLMQSVVDPQVHKELQNRMEENRRSRYELENRKRRENEAITRAENQIDNNRKMVAVNRVKTRNNEQRIEYLRACIELSLNENQDVESVLDNADKVRQEVESLLND